MDAARFQSLTRQYRKLRIAVIGDFCLDRYLEIDPTKSEVSIETNLTVHNITHIRSQPGAAGTILNNLVALGIGEVHAVGFCGEDGEGFELRKSLQQLKGVNTTHFISTPHRRTFTYTKPLVISLGKTPKELNRLDVKNWSPTPLLLQKQIISALHSIAPKVDAIILMDQVSIPETGVITTKVLKAITSIVKQHPHLLILADSRLGLKNFPPVCLKMNAAELAALTGLRTKLKLKQVATSASALAKRHGQNCFITLAQNGILAASPDGTVAHLPALPVRGPIDIVGAGDAVTANLTAAIASHSTLREALELANAAASIVIHKLATTGTASANEIQNILYH
ncbi:bifunctional heptose 7-phosphate kinase/heptose 1-phosphate adenyltransferase [Pedosphaera parvula]|uniref:PfkB domain protein n=1 Tax=Pedosphaera parvula (strain Ellin514) TaxID=320771 RepID=B9XFS9_PEDPL|nr:PfkB family carbohydrate kinase [Pedosphaera parvula]EEF61443.1 PfkB domain protein [Pedosphaera parvula Ellin514]